jgi:hypothetical protein
VYVGDLYHIRKHNPQLIREFISKLAMKATQPAENPLDIVHKLDEQALVFAHQICSEEVKGLGKDYEKMNGKGVLGVLVATAQHVISVVYEYKDFIQAFFATNTMPASVAYIRDMVRRVVVISDTDSTCFATGEWVQWMRGDMIFDPESLAISGAITYFATQTFLHTMALYSANINVEKAKLHTLAYKSEWTWTVMIPMNVAKHYCARAVIQEGNVFEEPELELKGVHLKNSNTPRRINKDVTAIIEEIQDTISENTKIKLVKLLNRIADMERSITKSLLEGSLEFYRQVKIKDATAYALGETDSPYQHHLFWEEVFRPKYGFTEIAPYAVAKIPTILSNPTEIAKWLQNIEDRDIAERLAVWMTRAKKTSFNTFYISSNFLRSFGMPAEIVSVIDTKRICVTRITSCWNLWVITRKPT